MATQTFTSQQQQHFIHNNQQSASENQGASIADYRPEAIAQAKMIERIHSSPKSVAQREANEKAFWENAPVQMMEEEDLMQGKFEKPVQMMEEEELMQGKFDKPVQMLEEEELMQGKFDKPVQMLEEEELMQGKFDKPVQMMEEEESMQMKTAANPIQQKAENGLPQDVNTRLESTLGADFSGVNIHANSGQATQMNALAYAQGRDVHFAPGQFKPDTTAGQKLIGHEFAHVVQQAEGRVKPTLEVNGMPVNDNKGLEQEADRAGEKVARS